MPIFTFQRHVEVEVVLSESSQASELIQRHAIEDQQIDPATWFPEALEAWPQANLATFMQRVQHTVQSQNRHGWLSWLLSRFKVSP
jgi:hypothetical protein